MKAVVIDQQRLSVSKTQNDFCLITTSRYLRDGEQRGFIMALNFEYAFERY